MKTGAGTVTILFTDLVGSTELLQRAGDEQAQRIFKAHHRLLREAVESHGGHEVKWLGDGLMVAFPSAADATRCAIAMQQLARLPTAGERLEIRVGLHVGEAIRDESDYFGTSVVIARRLCDKAGAGQIYASDLVVRLLAGRNDFRFEDLGALVLKGITDAVPAAEVLYEHDPLAMLARTPFVGRGEEMAALQRAFGEALAGRGSLVMLVGEPGIGKTRTAEEFRDLARDSGAMVLWGRCYEGEWAPPFSPFAEAILAYAETVDDEALRAALGKDAGTLARVVPALADRLPDLPEPPALPAEGERYRLLEAVSSFIGAAADGHTLVLVLDDLHWADNGTIAMLRHLAREARGQHFLVLGTYRDVELSRSHPLAGALADLRRETAFERITLKGLEHKEVERLLDVIAEQGVPEEFVSAIGSETAGNPFFIREVLLHLLEERKVTGTDGRWRASVTVAEMAIPEGVRDVIGRRLSRLSDAANRMLAVASAFDGGFDFDIVAAVSDLGEAAALDAIDEALAAQLLRGSGQDAYGFTHALIRQTLYEELSPSRKMRLHRQIGDAIEARYREDPERHLGELAYHFYRAAQAGAVDKAIGYCWRAGQQAQASLAPGDAITHYRHALELCDLLSHPDDSRRCMLLLDLGDAESYTGSDEYAAAIRTFTEAMDVARRVEDGDAFARAAIGYSDACIWGNGSLEGTVAPFEEAARILGSRRDSTVAKVLARLSWALGSNGRGDEGLRVCHEAIDLARTLDDDLAALAYVIDVTNFVRWRADAQAERQQLALELLDLTSGGLDDERKMWAHCWAGIVHLEGGDIAPAKGHFDEASRLAAELHIHAGIWYGKMWTAMWACLRGDLSEAETLSRDAFAFGHVAAAGVSHLAQMLYLNWEAGTLANFLPVQRTLIAQRADRQEVSLLRAVHALSCSEAGDPAGGQEQLGMLLANGCDSIAFDWMWLPTMTFLAETAVRLGSDACDFLYTLLAPYPRHNVIFGTTAVCLGSSSRVLGMLATSLQRWDDAERHFIDAIDMNTRMGAGPWVARTQMNYAEMLLRRDAPGDREKARSLLDEALAAAREMGMIKVAADCEGLSASL